MSIELGWQCGVDSCGEWNSDGRDTCKICGGLRKAAKLRPYSPVCRMLELAEDAEKTKKKRSPRGTGSKAEKEVWEIMKREYKHALVCPQSPQIVFSNGDTYTADFEIVFPFHLGEMPIIIEVKGSNKYLGYDQGIERFKRVKEFAKEHYRCKLFEKKNGKWVIS